MEPLRLKFAEEVKNRWIQAMLSSRWHLDETFVKINGETHFLWRAVDHKGEVLEAVVTMRRDKAAASKLLKKLLTGRGRSM